VIATRDPLRVLVAVAIAVLAGATAFGLWHVVVGGLVNGNPRAARFGVVLAAVAGALLAGAIAAFRRLPRG
jgi:hypothetical protein